MILANLFNMPAIPGLPNSKVGDLFGLSGFFGISNPFETASSTFSNLPYIIIGGGTLALVIFLKK